MKNNKQIILFNRGIMNLLGVLFLIIIIDGCLPSEKYLVSGEDHIIGESTSDSSITVVVRPVFTSGFFSEEMNSYGIDLSSYFTTFDLKIVNNTNKNIELDLKNIHLVDKTGQSLSTLNEDESIEYYRHGDIDPDKSKVLISKPYVIMKDEIEKIKGLRIESGNITPNNESKGIILFKKMITKNCEEVKLEIDGIMVEGKTERKKFEFQFQCKDIRI